MAGDLLDVKVRGVENVAAALRAVPAKLRRRAIMNALRAAGRVFRDEARRLTPVLSVPIIHRGRQIRTPGLVRKAISVRTSKAARRAGDLGVFVNVRPAKGGQRGAYSPTDPFYWRWLEFSRKGRPGRHMLQRALSKAADAIRRFGEVLGPAVEKLNRKDTP